MQARRIVTLRRALVLLAMGAVLGAASGCGAGRGASASSTPPAPATATSAPSPTPRPTVDPSALAACGMQQFTPGDVAQVGDLLLAQPRLTLAYPAVALPDGTALAPVRVDATVSNNVFANGYTGQFKGSTPANPSMQEPAGFEVRLCNPSSARTHTVRQVSVRIDAVAPYAGQLSAWAGCDTAFSRQQPGGGGGCGGGWIMDERLHASFPADAGAGVAVVAEQTGSGQSDGGPSTFGPLPVMLAPGSAMTLSVGITVPTVPGTYTFAVGVAIDDGAPAFGPPADPLLFAPVAHKFTGAACNAAPMLAQIPPATDPPSYYICPAA